MTSQSKQGRLIALAVFGGAGSFMVMVLLAWLAMFAGAKALTSSCATPATDTVPVSAPPNASLAQLFVAAAAHYRLGSRGPSILAAIAKVESDFGQNDGPSSAGAVGFMQFEPATWAKYGVDANGDGRKDPATPADAIYAAASYLKASGAPADWNQAIFAYNHSNTYVQTVIADAQGFAGNLPGTAAPTTDVGECDATGLEPSGAVVPGARPGLPVADFTGIVQGPHPTAGLPGFPAEDYGAPARSPVVAPVDGTVYKLSGHDPANGPSGPGKVYGWSVYIQSIDGHEYFLTHLGTRTAHLGQHLRQGEQIGTVADFAKYGTPNHIHMGIHQ